MTSILKVDTIQDTAGNNIINESSDTITIGASGDTITIPSGATISNLGTASGFGTNTPAFQAGRVGSGQTFTTGVSAEVIFNTERFDTDSCYDNANGRFTPNVSGKYFFYASVTYNNISAVYSECRIVKNGTPVAYGRNFNDIGFQSSFAYGTVELNGTTDYLSVISYHEHGSDRDIYHDAAGSASYFGAYKLIGV